VSLLTSSKLVEQSIEGGMGEREGDWCAPELMNPDDSNDDEVIVEVEDANEDSNAVPSTSSSNQHIKNEDYLDLEDESLALDDASTSQYSNAGAVAGENNKNNNNNFKLLQARRYDVSITYDNYYRTPRIWLFGK